MKKLIFFLLLPAVAGLLGGLGLHQYQASKIREDFTPYRTTSVENTKDNPRNRAYSFIAAPLDVNFGEVENYKRYRSEWEIVNSGRKPLEIELVSSSCDAKLDGKPITEKQVIQGGYVSKLEMSWVVDNSERNFSHELVFKTNDDVVERRTLRFHVYGTVNPAMSVEPATLDFGTLTAGETKELTSRIVCYRTKNFKIESFRLANESLQPGFVVKLVPVENPQSTEGDLIPSAGVDVVVTVKADSLNKQSHQTELLLSNNLPQSEGLKIRLKVQVE